RRYFARKALDLLTRWHLRPEDEDVKALCKSQPGQHLSPVRACSFEGSISMWLTAASTVGDAAHKIGDTQDTGRIALRLTSAVVNRLRCPRPALIGQVGDDRSRPTIGKSPRQVQHLFADRANPDPHGMGRSGTGG